MDYKEFYQQVYSCDKVEGAHGWIQWKGTNVCIDLHCVCGYHGHMDADFFYYYKCRGCERKYAVGQVVRLIELTPEQAAHVAAAGGGFMESDETR